MWYLFITVRLRVGVCVTPPASKPVGLQSTPQNTGISIMHNGSAQLTDTVSLWWRGGRQSEYMQFSLLNPLMLLIAVLIPGLSYNPISATGRNHAFGVFHVPVLVLWVFQFLPSVSGDLFGASFLEAPSPNDVPTTWASDEFHSECRPERISPVSNGCQKVRYDLDHSLECCSMSWNHQSYWCDVAACSGGLQQRTRHTAAAVMFRVSSRLCCNKLMSVFYAYNLSKQFVVFCELRH